MLLNSNKSFVLIKAESHIKILNIKIQIFLWVYQIIWSNNILIRINWNKKRVKKRLRDFKPLSIDFGNSNKRRSSKWLQQNTISSSKRASIFSQHNEKPAIDSPLKRTISIIPEVVIKNPSQDGLLKDDETKSEEILDQKQHKANKKHKKTNKIVSKVRNSKESISKFLIIDNNNNNPKR